MFLSSLLFVSLLLFTYTYSIQIVQHPLEKRAAFIYGIQDITKLSRNDMTVLQDLFQQYPLMVLKNVNNANPNEFIRFLTNFDNECDFMAIEEPDKHPHQILQPFDRFPNCQHVAPRGNAKIKQLFDIQNIHVKPSDSFVNQYVWHTDLLGHEIKIPNVVTGFYMIEQPLIGGDTDFISGETVYENLNTNEQITAQNMLLQINRMKFSLKMTQMDYSGVNRLEPYERMDAGNTFLPLVFAAENEKEIPRILLLPSFFEKVAGWSVDESRRWIRDFMYQKVLPYRFSIQWKKGDLGFFNNRRFMHSSTPARNYLEFQDSSTRLLLQTFIPTKKPLYGYKAYIADIETCMQTRWNINKESLQTSQTIFHNYYTSKKIINNKYLLID